MPKGGGKKKDNRHIPADRTVKRYPLDELDVKVLELMLAERESKNIASSLNKPLSTIQRRMRHLTDKGIVRMRAELDFATLGLSTGLLHVYLQSGDIKTTMKELLAFNGITSTEAHIGNSDLVCTFVFRDTKEVLNLISKTKKIEGVKRVVWSQRIYALTKPLELIQIQAMQGEKATDETMEIETEA